eukprot:CAMPEP_0196781950 /NCGR_PEP_ID=MMETSP1104-20130614/10453_1 /TAXON_ID=33652 /ORGANISM="Cafeteria sp., Strain Caron Lab Isolate" /LENGTH=416 /DNA_ID=CAMNT_0042152181 /DNA_START=50 /DNA_END=1300 /DNA_ORIENTATION=-
MSSDEVRSPTKRKLGEAVHEAPSKRRQLEAARLGGEVEVADLPVIDLAKFMGAEESDAAAEECKKVAEALHKYGCLIVRDPRVSMADNDRFVDNMEEYFERPLDSKMKEVKPELSYQIGATPDHTERPRNHCAKVAEMPDEHRPLSLCPPELDPKWRYFWHIGERPKETRFKQLNAEQVVPEGMPHFREVMDTWGSKMLAAVLQVARMAAKGFDLPLDTFTSRMNMGPHLLAPTGSDFGKYGQLGTVLAGYHYDLNFMTIHGKSRFPGLYVWLRDGRRAAVKVPDQCLLVQAGRQFEYITGGYVLAGYHEVVVAPSTLEAIERAKKEGRSLWRVSSTLFSHIASDQKLGPLPPFVERMVAGEADPEAARRALVDKYPEVFTGDQVEAELKAINLERSVSKRPGEEEEGGAEEKSSA